MRIVILGPPGAGKGTQAAILEKEFGMVHVSTGDLFRKNIKEQTELGKKVSAYLKEGKLVPDDLTIALVWDRLDQADVLPGFLLDGFPRTTAQAEALDDGLKERDRKLDGVLLIDVEREVLIRRIAGRRICENCGATYHVESSPPKVDGICDRCGHEVRQRSDDREETVRKRLEIYESETKPLVDYYRDQEILLSVDGAQEVEAVTRDILKAIKAL